MRLTAGSGGWFAAGEGCERALRRLSDPAFKVLAYVCLRAERASGWLEFESSGLARELGRSRASLGRCLRELVSQGICELEAAPNQHRGSRLRVREEYWPYEGRTEAAARTAAGAAGEVGAYVERVREMCSKPACVQAGFGPADERLAADWQRAGVSLETVRRAILLGSVRQLTSMIDRPGSEPVRSQTLFRRSGGGSAPGEAARWLLEALGDLTRALRTVLAVADRASCGACLFGFGPSSPSRRGRDPLSGQARARRGDGMMMISN